MATQIFDNDFLHTHPIYQNVHSTLVDVSNRDYAMAPFDKRIECLDMDDYEAHYMQNGATRIQQASAKLRNVFVKALLWC